MRTKPTKHKQAMRVAVIGAGWAGCAAACSLAERGHEVSLIEASRTLGGRARRVEIQGNFLDNGQHILLGAYSATLDLMKTLGIERDKAFLTLPLQMMYPPEAGGMQFLAPKLPAPLHLLFALLRSTGLGRVDKLALARFSTTARWMGWQLHKDCSVSELLDRFDQTERLCELMWIPLCLAALNTPPERASAQVFLNVLRDSLGAKRAASDMLLPRVDLSSLLPDTAAKFLQQHGGTVVLGTTVRQMRLEPNQKWLLECNHEVTSLAGEWDAVIIATQADHAADLVEKIHADEQDENSVNTNPNLKTPVVFEYESITTVYLQYPQELLLERPFYALQDKPKLLQWGQFVFDRGQLQQEQKGLMAVIISAAANANQRSHAELAEDVARQLAFTFKKTEFTQPIWQQVITEKRATFSCAPDLHRPDNTTAYANLFIAGDYTASDYPATLESAVRSGVQAAKLVST
jgi:hydroxysqualene dehydroxylase